MIRTLLFAMSLSLGILVADYYASNMSFPILDSSPDLAAHAYLHDYRMDDDVEDMFLAVNTAKDKAIAVEYDVFGREAGKVAVSDRQKLTEFLNLVADADYRYIFLDLRFEDNVVTPHDSAFYSLIASLPRLVYSCHRPEDDEDAHSEAAVEKGAFADYRNTTGSGFSRYEFVQDGHESVALRLFHDIILLLPDEKKHIENPFFSVVLSLLGWGASLWVLKSVLYWIFGLS
ncbi:MAG: hypothetical protein K2K37_00120, partial [Muribaculaceae bacterium]|nr:hypothetical protein [Muribaculaceae bacterium]